MFRRPVCTVAAPILRVGSSALLLALSYEARPCRPMPQSVTSWKSSLVFLSFY